MNFNYQKSNCPEGYLEALYKFISDNQFLDECSDDDYNLEDRDFTEFIFDVENAPVDDNDPISLNKTPCIMYFCYLIKDDIDEMIKHFLQIFKKDYDDEEVKPYIDSMNEVKKEFSGEVIGTSTYNETKTAVYSILCTPHGDIPFLIDDVGAKLVIKREDNENICFRTTDYIEKL